MGCIDFDLLLTQYHVRFPRRRASVTNGPRCPADNEDNGLEEDGAVLALLGLCGQNGDSHLQKLKVSRSSVKPEDPVLGTFPLAEIGVPGVPGQPFRGEATESPSCWPIKPPCQVLDLGLPGLTSMCGQGSTGSPVTLAQTLVNEWRAREQSRSLVHARLAHTAQLLSSQLSDPVKARELASSEKSDRLMKAARFWEISAEPMCCQVLVPDGALDIDVPSISIGNRPVAWQSCTMPGCRYLLSTGPYCCDHLLQISQLKVALPHTAPGLPCLEACSNSIALDAPADGQDLIVFAKGSPIMVAPPLSSGNLHVLDLAMSQENVQPNIEVRVSRAV